MLKKEAKAITGGLSRPGKMPEGSYNLPATDCITGSKLVKIPGTVCHKCYALKFRYNFRNVKAALAKRAASLKHDSWTAGMVRLITGMKHFRWHDSGDLQGVDHLKKIFEVCKATPGAMHWLPTREAWLFKYMDPAVLPKNLLVRISGMKIDGAAPSWWPWTSTVVSRRPFWKLGLWFNKILRIKGKCFAPIQGNACRSCRQCWSRDVKNVIYSQH